jgi:ferredoxin-NADP reductase
MQPIPQAQTLRVRRMSWEADGVVSLILGRDDRTDLPPFTCGAHIDLILRPDLIRQYSLCSDPGVRGEWTIAVLLDSESRGGSSYVHTVVRPGMTVSAMGPRNNFPLVDAQRYLFIAGGIGITPILPMVREVESQGKGWTMLYGGRRRASMAFVDDLSEFGLRATIAPQDECGLLDLKSAIDPLPANAAVYCCGPEVLISAVENTCTELGRADPHVESFSARGNAGSTDNDEDNQPFEVVLANSGKRVTIPADKTITEVLADAGIYVPTSCTEGFCGTCETEVVAGTPDHRDEYLTDEERRTNKTMMVCVGRSKTAVLTLKI